MRQLVNAALEQFGLAQPELAVGDFLGLQALPRSERRERERGLFERTLQAKAGPSATVGWLPSGKPVVTGPGGAGLQISLAHDDRTCLCVVGFGLQGCDIEEVRPRSADDWNALLGDARAVLLTALVQGGDSLNRAGTRIWSAVEAVRKATQAVHIDLEVDRRLGTATLLKFDGREDPLRVLTLPVRLTRGPERMIALVVASEAESSSQAVGGINPEWHRVSVTRDGPQGQPVQELRFVVSFQESSSLSRRVPASKYLVWMGKMRELVTSSRVPSLVDLIATGDWGLVTNWGDVRICGEAKANDVIQMRFWTDEAKGSEVEFSAISGSSCQTAVASVWPSVPRKPPGSVLAGTAR